MDKEKLIENAKKIMENGGNCLGVGCNECPCSGAPNCNDDEVVTYLTNWLAENDPDHEDLASENRRLKARNAELTKLINELQHRKQPAPIEPIDPIVQVSGFAVNNGDEYYLVGLTKSGRVVMSRGDKQWADVSPDAVNEMKRG